MSFPRTQWHIVQFRNRTKMDNLALHNLRFYPSPVNLRSCPLSCAAASWNDSVKCFSQRRNSNITIRCYSRLSYAASRVLATIYVSVKHKRFALYDLHNFVNCIVHYDISIQVRCLASHTNTVFLIKIFIVKQKDTIFSHSLQELLHFSMIKSIK